MEGPKCAGCSNSIEEGSVIAFGDALFHLKCFVCAKCSEPVDCESNLLLLANGRPVCESCSYCCTACKQIICDEAIMTGDDAYHADCFRCVSCKQKIKDLVFTQTSKGIHCTSCHEKRRAHKQKRREEREKRLQLKQDNHSTNSIPQQSSRTSRLTTSKVKHNVYDRRPSADPPTPSRSRSNSAEGIPKIRLDMAHLTPSKSEGLLTTTPSSTAPSPNSPPLSIASSLTSLKPSNHTASSFDDMPVLNFSFFDNESSDLINLTKTLGANIIQDNNNKRKSVPENIARASQLLQTSLMADDDDDDYDNFPRPPLLSHSDHVLRQELESANLKIVTIQASYGKIKEASRQALDELSRAKEEFAKEVALRQQQEFLITQLKQHLQLTYRSKSMTRTELSVVTREEIERVAKLRAELDRTCNELKSYRNVLVKDIESLVRQKQDGLESHPTSHLEEQQKALVCEIKSLKEEKEHILNDKKSLESMRDETLQEMVILNTKYAQLTDMNNDLARRINDRETFLSPSVSSELMQLKSTESPSPKTFKLKKKGNVFSKFKKVDPASAGLYAASNNTSSSLNIAVSPTAERKPEPQQHGAHLFLQTSFIRPVKCDVCSEKMWGLSELRCQGCLYTTHARCLPHVPQLCHASHLDLNEDVKLFGGDLSDRCRFEDRPIPLIIETCIRAVEKRGMDYEGIYRKSGGAAQIRLIIQSFEQLSEPIDLEDEEQINDICAVTSVLKQYFRDLSNPLLSFELYSQFIDAVSMTNQIEKFKELLSQLPTSNYETLQLLIHHLYSVQERHHENLMTTKNLAMVFGPTLLRDSESSRDLIDMSSKNAVVECLILNAKELLPK